MKGVGVPMKRLLIGIMMIMTAVTVFTGCGNKEEQSSSESENTNTVEYFQEKLNGTFAGSNDTTYIFSDGKITQQYEKDGSQAEKKAHTRLRKPILTMTERMIRYHFVLLSTEIRLRIRLNQTEII